MTDEKRPTCGRWRMVTKDGVEIVAGLTVYGVNPWGDIETVYVEDGLERASTCFPTEASGAGACSTLSVNCYADRKTAEVAAMLQGDWFAELAAAEAAKEGTQ